MTEKSSVRAMPGQRGVGYMCWVKSTVDAGIKTILGVHKSISIPLETGGNEPLGQRKFWCLLIHSFYLSTVVNYIFGYMCVHVFALVCDMYLGVYGEYLP